MNTARLISLLLTLVLPAPAALAAPGPNCGCDCCKDKPQGEACCCHAPEPTAAAKADDGITRHELQGVVTRVIAGQSALMVKHEAIPGVMGAMTMMFKVDAATLRAVEKGQSITGQMSRQGDHFVLEDVKVVDGKKR